MPHYVTHEDFAERFARKLNNYPYCKPRYFCKPLTLKVLEEHWMAVMHGDKVFWRIRYNTAEQLQEIRKIFEEWMPPS